jgi:hypothetical protein
MKFSLAGILAGIATGMALLSSAAQTAAPAPSAQQPASQSTPAQPAGKVIFSRSIDENGQTTTQVNAATAQSSITKVDKPVATDQERQSVTFTDIDLDVRLRTIEQHIAVRALITVRNDGKSPLTRIPLQISSTLQWERIRIASPAAQLNDVAFPVAILKSDADHTGQLNEATVPLAQPLAPGATLRLDVTYSGDIPATAQRLAVIDTPTDVALHSDWDQISVPFTGLRGFGNVVWYPVSSVPAFLGEGVRLFDEIGTHKLRLSGAHFRLRLTCEFPHDQPPTIALINGHPVPLAVITPGTSTPAPDPDLPQTQPDPTQAVPGVATADSGPTTLGFEAPSLFLAIRTAHSAANATLFALPEDAPAIPAWSAAAIAVTPFLRTWLGQKPRSQLTILDLPDPADAPFETGSLLATSIQMATPIQNADPQANPDRLNTILVHSLTRAWLESPQPPPSPNSPAWLSEGVATFMDTLWVQSQHGHDQALGPLEAARPALALAEPASPGESPGQPLAQAISPVYYRTKAAYVLWMLRDTVGDEALSAALRAYNPAQDSANPPQPASFESLLKQAVTPSSSPSPPQPSAVPAPDPSADQDPSWLFADWIDADKGLPDLTIDNVFPTAQSDGNWLVAVNVTNHGYASAQVPVTVRTVDKFITRRLLVPARGSAVQRILILGKPTQVQVNDGNVPEIQASVHITTLGPPVADPASSSQSSESRPPQP